MSEAALALDQVARVFIQGSTRLEILNGISLTVAEGEIVGLVGPSGSGKSTLLHIAGLLEHPDDGDVFIGGTACNGLSDAERTRLRREQVGFIYQFHHLLPEFSAEENVILPQMIAATDRGVARERARELLAILGLEARAEHRPGRLSGGEQQRVAIARALANRPKILLADEPTGNLDPATADAVFAQLLGLVRDTSVAALVATHNHDLAARMDRTLSLEDGVVVAR